jgi:hypothetical protein
MKPFFTRNCLEKIVDQYGNNSADIATHVNDWLAGKLSRTETVRRGSDKSEGKYSHVTGEKWFWE